MEIEKEVIFNKGYKAGDLCETFGQKKLRGTYLTTFINKLKKEYVITKKGQYYYLERELTDEERLMIEIKDGYQKAIEIVLSDRLSKIENNNYCFSTMELLIELGMVTDDYKYCKYNINETALVLETDPYEIEQYIEVSYDLLSTLIKNVIERLQDKSLVMKADAFKVYKRLNGKMVDLRQATKNEVNTIMQIKNQVYEELGVSGKKELYSTKRYLIEKYNQLCSQKCKEFNVEFDGFFDAIELTIEKSGLKRNVGKVISELNSKTQDKLLTAKGLKEIKSLDLLIEATLRLDRPYKIKENVKKIQGSII